MDRPTRVQLFRKAGWRMPANTVSVARPTRYGNPFKIGDPGVPDAATAVRLFEASVATLAMDYRALAGRNLACWCALDAPCHADVLLRLAN